MVFAMILDVTDLYPELQAGRHGKLIFFSQHILSDARYSVEGGSTGP